MTYLATLLFACAALCAEVVFGVPYGGATAHPIKVAYQGEPGAYSEKSLRQLVSGSVRL